MIIRCPHCQRMNRLPDTPQGQGLYRCSNCQETLAASGSNRALFRAWFQARFQAAPTIDRRTWAVVLLNLAYLLALLTLSLTNAAGPEGWWLGSLNLYLPQWLWALPILVLGPLTWALARRLTWVPLAALVWVFGPIMGLCWHGGWPARPDGPILGAASGHLRVMTYNVKWGRRDADAVIRDIAAFHPDLIQMQDSGGVAEGTIGRALTGWNVQVDGQYLVASRLPLSPLQAYDISYPGSQHHCVRYTLRVSGAEIAVYNVHLLSPREGLISVRHRQTGGMEGNAEQRQFEAGRLAKLVGAETGPTLVTGDLNAPVQSLVCRSLFGAGLRDAFTEAGFGYGYTYGGYTRIGQPYVRIDHILASRQWQIRHCWVGNAVGSDHCPVIADLTLKRE